MVSRQHHDDIIPSSQVRQRVAALQSSVAGQYARNRSTADTTPCRYGEELDVQVRTEPADVQLSPPRRRSVIDTPAEPGLW
jgi:hypothetical protein